MTTSRDLFEQASNQYAEIIHTNRSNKPGSYESYLSFFRTYILPHLPADKEAKILDVGCGAGHLLYALCRHGYVNSWGTDSSEQQIQEAQKWVHCVEKADALEFLPRHKDEYDVVTLIDVVEHMDKNTLYALLLELISSLRANGVVIFHTTNGWSPFSRFYYLGDLTHQQLYSPKMLGDVTLLAGFEEYHYFPSEPERLRMPCRASPRSLIFLALRVARYTLWRLVSRGYALATYIAIGGWNWILTPNFFLICRKGPRQSP